MIKIEHIEKVCGTQAMPILVEAWAVLLRTGLCPLNQWPLSWDMSAMIAKEGSVVVGVIGFGHQEWSREIIINIGFVFPAWRRKNVYTLLWEALVQHAQQKGVPSITSGTAVNNTALREFCKRTGRKETRVVIDFEVPGVIK